ncbi:hypothetical protein LTSEHVI_1376, partial [Salmonella enterica subsp. enterica serovar Hvittingfoss str. A4-620]
MNAAGWRGAYSAYPTRWQGKTFTPPSGTLLRFIP